MPSCGEYLQRTEHSLDIRIGGSVYVNYLLDSVDASPGAETFQFVADTDVLVQSQLTCQVHEELARFLLKPDAMLAFLRSGELFRLFLAEHKIKAGVLAKTTIEALDALQVLQRLLEPRAAPGAQLCKSLNS
jgi:hypothetical protein